MTATYFYGVTIDKLPDTQTKLIYGEKLLDELVKQHPLDVKRIQAVANQYNLNNKILKGGI